VARRGSRLATTTTSQGVAAPAARACLMVSMPSAVVGEGWETPGVRMVV
jgi:hypothetical protein